MKKIFFFTLFFLCSPRRALYIALFFVPCFNAQGNLQFNQVLTYTQSFNMTIGGGGLYSFNSASNTVPNGKTWKVEKFGFSGANGVNSGWLIINNIHGMIQSDVNTSPIWLKAGDVLKVSSSCGSCNSISGSYFISILEFNIIP